MQSMPEGECCSTVKLWFNFLWRGSGSNLLFPWWEAEGIYIYKSQQYGSCFENVRVLLDHAKGSPNLGSWFTDDGQPVASERPKWPRHEGSCAIVILTVCSQTMQQIVIKINYGLLAECQSEMGSSFSRLQFIVAYEESGVVPAAGSPDAVSTTSVCWNLYCHRVEGNRKCFLLCTVSTLWLGSMAATSTCWIWMAKLTAVSTSRNSKTEIHPLFRILVPELIAVSWAPQIQTTQQVMVKTNHSRRTLFIIMSVCSYCFQLTRSHLAILSNSDW